MPLFIFSRMLTSLLSLLMLGAAAYLLWSWYEGRWFTDALGVLVHEREPWRLWTGLGLAAWSFLGGRLLPFVLARRDTRPSRAAHGRGEMLPMPSGSQVWVERTGREAGPTILLTHGWGMDSTFWNYAKEDLGDRFSIVAWDLPGLGRSKLAPSGRVCLEDFARDLADLAQRLGGVRPILVGHSIGGMTLQTLVRDHPEIADRLGGLVLVDTTHTNPLRTMIASGLATALRPVLEIAMRLTVWLEPLVWLMNWQSYLSGSAHLAHRLGFGRYVTRSQLEHATLLSTRNRPGVEARGNLAMFRWDATGALGRLRTPTLVIAGDADIVTKLDANRRIADSSPLAQLRVAEGANHLGPLERADLYDRWIGEFAQAAQARPGRMAGQGEARGRSGPDIDRARPTGPIA